MNKKELINAAAKKSALTIKETEAAFNAIMAVMEEALLANDKVQLTGFGTFDVKCQEERDCRNPRTGEQIHVSASRKVTFTPSVVLKKKLNDQE